MIAVYSLWNNGDKNNTAAFNSVDDLMSMMKLSMLQSAKYFERVILVTDSIGAARAEKYGLNCEVRVELDQLPMRREFWSMPKLLAMVSVGLPMTMHIDCDFIWWKDPAKYWTDQDLFFQNPEPYKDYFFYSDGMEFLKKEYPQLYRYAQYTDYAYNCGVTGVKDPETAKILLARAMEMAKIPDILERFDSDDKPLLNLIFEQSFYASLSVERKMKVGCIINDFADNTNAITHLLSHAKKNPILMTAVKKKLSFIQKYHKPKMTQVA